MKDSDNLTVDMEEDSDRFDFFDSEKIIEKDCEVDEDLDSDSSDEFLVEDESKELDCESDEQNKTEDKVQLKPTDAISVKLIDLHLKALGRVENFKAINTLKMDGKFSDGKKIEYDLLQGTIFGIAC